MLCRSFEGCVRGSADRYCVVRWLCAFKLLESLFMGYIYIYIERLIIVGIFVQVSSECIANYRKVFSNSIKIL